MSTWNNPICSSQTDQKTCVFDLQIEVKEYSPKKRREIAYLMWICSFCGKDVLGNVRRINGGRDEVLRNEASGIPESMAGTKPEGQGRL